MIDNVIGLAFFILFGWQLMIYFIAQDMYRAYRWRFALVVALAVVTIIAAFRLWFAHGLAIYGFVLLILSLVIVIWAGNLRFEVKTERSRRHG